MSDTARTGSFRGRRFVNAGLPRVGRLQLQIRRAFVADEGAPLTTRELLSRCYPAADHHPRWHRWNIHRALPKVAVRLDRDMKRQGGPVLWSPRPDLMRQIRGNRG